jgi:hypothetical protein
MCVMVTSQRATIGVLNKYERIGYEMIDLRDPNIVCRFVVWDKGVVAFDANFKVDNDHLGLHTEIAQLITKIRSQEGRLETEKRLQKEYKELYGVDMPVPEESS